MKLEIDNNGIEIGKVNVVGGVNSTGKSTVSKLLYCYLKSLKDDESLEYLMASEGISSLENCSISFKNNNYIPSEVFYIDNISVLDLKDLEFLKIDHITHIKDALEKEQVKTCTTSQKIQDLIKTDCLTSGSAGIRQVGVIQILLQNGCLCEDSFLIIDEPESGLHPDWQIRYAEILISLVKELDISVYLNSYSPIFIEAVSLYCQYHGLIGKTSFYLTGDCDGFSFKRINPKNMGEVYENLTKPYDELDRLKAKIIFRK